MSVLPVIEQAQVFPMIKVSHGWIGEALVLLATAVRQGSIL